MSMTVPEHIKKKGLSDAQLKLCRQLLNVGVMTNKEVRAFLGDPPSHGYWFWPPVARYVVAKGWAELRDKKLYPSEKLLACRTKKRKLLLDDADPRDDLDYAHKRYDATRCKVVDKHL